MTSTNTAALEHRGQAESDGPALDVAVVGAGQAGLAMAWHLRRHGLRFAVLDAATQLGQTWRTRWDSLRLFTPARFDALPEMPFPGPAEHYPTKDEVADYLHDYATAFDLPIHLDQRVLRLSPDPDGYRLQTTRGAVRARQVVMATGPFQTPHVPESGTGLARGVTQLHGSAYRNPAQLPAGPVLVVGDGNSGRQIAAELAATRRVDLATSGTATVLPQRILGRDLFWWLTRLGLLTANADSPLGRRIRARGELVIGTTDRTLREAGVTLRPRLVAADGATARFADGSTLALDTVIWATGFRPDHTWIDVPGVRAGNRIVHDHGLTAAPGLYVLGQPWQHSRGSALLGFVARDAADLTHHIATAATRRNHRCDTGPAPRRLDPAPALAPTSPQEHTMNTLLKTVPKTLKARLRPATPVGHFVHHYLQMVVAMLVGMIALGPVWSLAGDALGITNLLRQPEPTVLIMATNMTIAMCGWMCYRGHRWRPTLEMAAAMYLPFLALFPPLWLGILSPTGLMLYGHMLMLPAMAAAMLLRPAEYTGHHHHTQSSPQRS